MQLVVLGPPGAGKGTQAKKLSENYKFFHFGAGDILRAKKDDPLVKENLSRGNLVPISVIEYILKDFFKEIPKNIIWDGLPRSLEQANLLENLLKSKNKKIDLVVNFKLNKEDLIQRIVNRIICSKCGEVYNLRFKPPAKREECNLCKGKLIKREDDSLEVISKRLETYENETAPLLSFYKSKSFYKEIDALQTTDEIYKELEKIIKEKL